MGASRAQIGKSCSHLPTAQCSSTNRARNSFPASPPVRRGRMSRGRRGGEVASPLGEPLSPEQQTLIGVIGEPFTASGELPVWQYVDLKLDDQHGLDAASVLASLPDAGDRSPTSRSYGLIWRPDSHRQPLPDDKIALTVAGMCPLPAAMPPVYSVLGSK